MRLDYRDTRPLYLQIIDDLRRQIRLGLLSPGDKLPSVREMAAQLSINPNTIQRAYRQLEMEGWICTVMGKGCFVSTKPAQSDEQDAALLQRFTREVRELYTQGFTREQLLAVIEEEYPYA